MVNNAVCAIAIGYGIGACIALQRRGSGREGAAVLLLCVVVAAYCAPVIGKSMPTVESAYKRIYGPISSYMLEKLGIR
ncbi:hypothetical protein SAMN05216312_11730 [Cohnella sp. OV330]|uniref:hypothetical protein n=1 Tax=Cohnella sp. OV330 TaxID=1855288 RepID=UPI0008ED43D4|nr:hypothetical protein [Cohnella sp. OV330]SFB60672.1 hypothetical protein SAMN05216312_11730 [Cohnella sp. OV330]